MEPVHKLIPVRSTRPSPSEARAFRLTSATSGGGDEHVANDDNDGRNADSDGRNSDSDGRNSDSDDADSMDNTRTHSMTAYSADSIRTDGTGSNRIRSTGNVGLC